jgi:Protein of unknown function (DUF1360)
VSVRIPELWTFALLALAAFRLTRLIGWDVVTRPLREPLTGRQESGSAKQARDSHKGRRMQWHQEKLDDFIDCPFCVGFWTCVAVWVLWDAWPRWITFLAVPWALSAVVGLVTKDLDG